MKNLLFSVVAGLLLTLVTLHADSLPQVGIQAYTLRSYTYEQALQKAESLGIHNMEIYPGQKIDASSDLKTSHSLDAAGRAKILQMAKDHGIRLVSYGVVNGRNEADWEQIFGFAKDLNLICINCQATPATLGYLDGLSKKYGIKVALHNHPGIPGIINPGNPYADPNVAYQALQNCGTNIGVCADTGHWVRTGFNPVEALHLLRGHIVELHFKDLDQGNILGKDMPWGTGISHAGEQLAELRSQGFDGIVLAEYENNTPELMENLKKCVTYFQGALTAPLADLVDGAYLPPGFSKDVETQIHNPEALQSGRWPEPQALLAENLSNATVTPANAWKFDKGILLGTGAGTIATKEAFQNYNLSFDFACTDTSRAKVRLKSTPSEFPEQDLDIVIAGGIPTKDTETTGSVLVGKGKSSVCFTPTRPLPIKSGDWNSLVIKAKGSLLLVYLNHELLNTISLKSFEKAFKITNTPAPKTAPAVGAVTSVSLAKPSPSPITMAAHAQATTVAKSVQNIATNPIVELISATNFTTATPLAITTNSPLGSISPLFIEKAPITLINDASSIKVRSLKIDPPTNAATDTKVPSTSEENFLSPEEKAAGWQLLFNGKDFAGWHNFGTNMVKPGWKVEEGCLVCADPHTAGDIVTEKKYGWFELELDYSISPAGNSGIMYHVLDDGNHKHMWQTGPEFQLEDNQLAADHIRCGWLYGLYQPPIDPATGKILDATKPVGQWNHVRLVIRPERCEHFINGVKYFEYLLNGPDFKKRVAASKFGKIAGFAEAPEGYIGLQGDHGAISFRNIKIRPIAP